MSAAPHPSGRSPPHRATAQPASRGRSACRRALAGPGRSSSPLRGCGRSTWTRSGTRRPKASYAGPPSALDTAPVLMERFSQRIGRSAVVKTKAAATTPIR